VDKKTISGIDKGEITLFTLSTCAWCEKLKMFLEHLGVQHDVVDVDMCPDEEQEQITSHIDSLAEKWGFPTIVINNETAISGFKPNAIVEALGMSEQLFELQLASIDDDETKDLQQKLDAVARKKGIYLNPKQDITSRLIKSLLVNQRKYGYRVCPCRLASGDKETDRDIICPCDYRDADIEEFGNCFCALYVNENTHKGNQETEVIPERRPK
jgi:ferredoxin-thioredoxin reductase catalytic subunit/glutaredoxin